MLESYEHEVLRKRRASRIFWGVVLLFAFFLYFFFQGYYPSLDFSLREVFTTGGVKAPEVSELVKSFGIINVKTTPRTANLSLGSGSYGNDEKRMVSYGDYSLLITEDTSLPARLDFSIEKEKPYYIDAVNLVKTPEYSREKTELDHIAKIRDNEWIAETKSGMLLLDTSLSGGVALSGDRFTHIGEGYYLSGRTLFRYDSTKNLWERKSWSGSSDFISRCDSLPNITHGYLTCPSENTLLDGKGKTSTGITHIYESAWIAGDRLMREGREPIALTGSEKTSSLFFERDGTWYSLSGGVFRVLALQKDRKPPLSLETGLDEVRYVTWSDGEILVFGKKGSDTFLSFLDPLGEHKSRTIAFPDIPMEAVRIEMIDGNRWIKTQGALLMIYRGSDRIHWIVDGEILTFSDTAALYRKDGKLWRASWERE